MDGMCGECDHDLCPLVFFHDCAILCGQMGMILVSLISPKNPLKEVKVVKVHTTERTQCAGHVQQGTVASLGAESGCVAS